MGRLVYRGGSCFSNPRILRSAYRITYQPDIRFAMLGFRVVEDIGDARYRVIRGGSWDNVSCPSSATRSVNEPSGRRVYLGFRVVEGLK